MWDELIDDDAGLAVLADRWAEQGHSLGEFIALQLAGDRGGELQALDGREWLGGLAEFVVGTGVWERGRLRELALVAETPLALCLAAVGALRTLERLDLQGRGPLMQADERTLWAWCAGRSLKTLRLAMPITWVAHRATALRERPVPTVHLQVAGGLLVLEREGGVDRLSHRGTVRRLEVHRAGLETALGLPLEDPSAG